VPVWNTFKNVFRRCARWALPVFLTLIVIALAWIWFFYDAQRQDKLVRTAGCLIAAYVGFLVWVVFGSGWKARARWTVFIVTIATIAFCRFGLRISGVTGDLIPIVEWRWKSRSVATRQSVASIPAATNLSGSYPQFLGPNRAGTLASPSLARDWHKTTPRERWRRSVSKAQTKLFPVTTC
jgi:hypothetical protein